MDRLEAVERLAGLRDSGVLSDADFQKQKERLLNGPATLPAHSRESPSASTMLGSVWSKQSEYSGGLPESGSRRRSLAVLGGLSALLAFNNPDESDLRKEFAKRINAQIVEKGKSNSGVALFGGLLSASGLIEIALTRIPIERTNFLVFSRFDIDFSAVPFMSSAETQHMCLIGVMGRFAPCSVGVLLGLESASTDEPGDAPNSASATQPTSGEIVFSEPPENVVEEEPADAVAPAMPSFGDYSVELANAVAPLQLERGSWFWDYRTRLRDAYTEEANFGANARIVLWGCGTGCTFGALLDRSTGTVHELPLGGEDQQQLDIQSQAGSNLLLANWNDVSGSDPVCVFEALFWTGTQFSSVAGSPKRAVGNCPLNDSV